MVRKGSHPWLGKGMKELLGRLYDMNVARPASWWGRSVVLNHAANVIWERFMPAWTKCLPHTGHPSDADLKTIQRLDLELLGPWRLLVGLTLESGVKALLVAKQPNRVKDGKVHWPGIAKAGHDLPDLFREAGIKVDRDEHHMLEELTESVVWLEKYPVPKKRVDMTWTKTNVRKWPRLVVGLLARVQEELPEMTDLGPIAF